MKEADYFSALQDLLDTRIFLAPSAKGGHYVIGEPGQTDFVLNTNHLPSLKAIQLEKMRPLDWPCFKNPHSHAQKRCDSILVIWDKVANVPKFLLVELKSRNPGTARKQLGASLAFCHFVHRMVCVNQPNAPAARFAAITVMTLPFAQKTLSIPSLPVWERPPLQADCPHMRFNRAQGSLPIAAVVARF